MIMIFEMHLSIDNKSYALEDSIYFVRFQRPVKSMNNAKNEKKL